MSEERVTIRLPSDTLALLQSLVDDGSFPSLSDAVITAVDDLIEARIPPGSAERILSGDSPVPYIDMDAITVGESCLTPEIIHGCVESYIARRG